MSDLSRVRLVVFLLCCLVFAYGFRNSVSYGAEAPNYQWVVIGTGPGDDLGSGTAVDSERNVYFSSFILDGELDGVRIPNNRFVLGKFTSAGNRAWLLSYPTANNNGNRTYSVLAVDANDDLIVSMHATARLVIQGQERWGSILAKYSKTGSLLWAIGQSDDAPPERDLTVDPNGNYILAFCTQGTFEYGGTVISSSNTDVLIQKVAPDGSLIWIRRGSGAFQQLATGVVTDRDGNIYAVGHFQSAIGFSGLTLQLASDIIGGFVVKYDSSGNAKWARKIEGTSRTEINGITIGGDGKLAVVGRFGFSVRIGSETLAGSDSEGFIAKLDQDGNFLSASKLGSGVLPRTLKTDPEGQLVVGGVFMSNAFGIPSRGSSDIFISRLSTAGALLWAKSIGNTEQDYLGQVAIARTGEIYVAGTFNNGSLFDSEFVEGIGRQDAFLAQIGSSSLGLPQLTQSPSATQAFFGSAVMFTVAAQSTSALKYQWFLNNAMLAGETNSSLKIPSVTAAHEGYYFVEVTNDAGTVRSAAAQLVIKGQVPVLVTTVAGSNSPGYVDATVGSAVRFNQPNGLAYLPGGLIAVADGWNHLIRLIDVSGASGTFAGQNSPGYVEGSSSVAKFNFPLSLTADRNGDVLVADTENNMIRRVSAFGLRNVSTVAGSGVRGYRDGPALEAEFHFPNDLVVAANGNIFVTEFTNHTVRVIAPSGVVSTFAGNGRAGDQDGVGTTARLNQPGGIATDATGNLYLTEWGGHRIRKITPQGVVTTLAGTNQPGFMDGQGSAARFHTPDGITVDANGNLYVTEHGNHAIRKIDPQGNVTTIAGLGSPGFKDGDRTVAMFNSPGGIMWHPSGSLYVSDTYNHSIRRIDFVSATNSETAELFISLNPALTIFGKVGKAYRIEAAEDGFTPLNWIVLDTITLTNATEMWADPQPATRNKRFYRAVQAN